MYIICNVLPYESITYVKLAKSNCNANDNTMLQIMNKNINNECFGQALNNNANKKVNNPMRKY